MNDSWHDLMYDSNFIELNVSPQMQPAVALAQIASDRRRDKARIEELEETNRELALEVGRLRGQLKGAYRRVG